MLRRGDTVIRAAGWNTTSADDLARARGNVRINRAGNVFEGPLLELQVDAFQGFFNEPRYRFLRNDAYGRPTGSTSSTRSARSSATPPTPPASAAGPSWMPDWILRAASLSLDQEEETGEAEGAVLSFMGVPILPVPALSLPAGRQAQVGRAAAYHRPGQQERARTDAALLLEHRAEPGRHAVPHADDAARHRPGRRVPLPGARLRRRAARQLPAQRPLRRAGPLGLLRQHTQPLLQRRLLGPPA